MGRRKNRYDVIRTMFDQGEIRSLSDIFQFVPKTVVAGDLGKKVARFNTILNRPGSFTLKDIYLLGHLCGLTERQVYELFEKYYLNLKEEKINKTKL
jgi:hypothetical protein